MSARVEPLQRAPAWMQGGAVALGCGAIAAQHPSYPSVFAVFVVGALGAIGIARADLRPASALRWAGAAATGCVAFALTRAFAAPIGIRITGLGLLFLAGAAIAEELFFRRFVYGLVEGRAGPGAAIAVSAVLFAVVHLPMYGMRAMPVDLVAGLLLGWQRWVSGTWTASAITHVVANFLQMG